MNTHDVVVDVQVRPPGEAVARYVAIVSPPSSTGSLQESVIWVPLLMPLTAVGAPGVAAGEWAPVASAVLVLEPALFVACTLNR